MTAALPVFGRRAARVHAALRPDRPELRRATARLTDLVVGLGHDLDRAFTHAERVTADPTRGLTAGYRTELTRRFLPESAPR